MRTPNDIFSNMRESSNANPLVKRAIEHWHPDKYMNYKRDCHQIVVDGINAYKGKLSNDK